MQGLGSQLCKHVIDSVCKVVEKEHQKDRNMLAMYKATYDDAHLEEFDKCETCNGPYHDNDEASNMFMCTHLSCGKRIVCGRFDCVRDKVRLETCSHCHEPGCKDHFGRCAYPQCPLYTCVDCGAGHKGLVWCRTHVHLCEAPRCRIRCSSMCCMTKCIECDKLVCSDHATRFAFVDASVSADPSKQKYLRGRNYTVLCPTCYLNDQDAKNKRRKV
jgi:hypothetical protein